MKTMKRRKSMRLCARRMSLSARAGFLPAAVRLLDAGGMAQKGPGSGRDCRKTSWVGISPILARAILSKIGLFMFTIRNGHPRNWKTRQGKLYAEKILIVDVDQVTPMHFHWIKMEDIINRGGGRLVIQLYNSTPDEDLDRESPVQRIDGRRGAYRERRAVWWS